MYTCWLKRTHPESTTFMQPRNLQPAEPTSITDEFSHIRPLSPEAVLVEETSRIWTKEDIVFLRQPTNSQEAQKSDSNGATMEHIRTRGSDLAGVQENHTPQVAMTPLCNPRLLTSTECLRML